MAESERDTSLLEDNEDHPIPFVYRLDVVAKHPNNRANLAIIVASPMKANAEGHERLMSKLEAYMGFIHSEEYRSEFGEPDPKRTTITVRIHRESDSYYVDLLEKCRDWVRSSGATLEVEQI